MLLEALIDTLLMVGTSAFVGVFVGSLLGIALFITGGKLKPHILIYRLLDTVINAVRSLPYLILMIALIPFTRCVAGSAIGMKAAIVPLSVASIFLWARVVQETLSGLPVALTEMGLVMGLSTRDIIQKILWLEARPSLIRQGALMVVQLIGFSAMAGTVGGGGLGDVAVRYGYQRYDTLFMLEVVAILIVLVHIVQWGANVWVQRYRRG